MGSNIAKILHGWGHKVIAVSDSKGGIYNPAGLDIDKVMSKQIDKRKVPELENVKKITNEELLELDCDVLVPAAISNQITGENADRIKSKIILEMAHAPITPNADDILFNRGIRVVPDILANAGGVIVSYFEWMQNLENSRWTKEKVFKELEEKMISALDKVLLKCENKCNLRKAAYTAAIDKIIQAEKERGG